jgi:hypothetical protein
VGTVPWNKESTNTVQGMQLARGGKGSLLDYLMGLVQIK